MPEIDVLAVIAAHEEVELAIAVIIKPQRSVGIDPFGKTCLRRLIGKTVSLDIVKEHGLAPFDEEQIGVAIIVVITPDRTHGYAGADLIHVSNSELRSDIGESSVVIISVQGVLTAFAAIGHVKIKPAIAIVVDHRNR